MDLIEKSLVAELLAKGIHLELGSNNTYLLLAYPVSKSKSSVVEYASVKLSLGGERPAYVDAIVGASSKTVFHGHEEFCRILASFGANIIICNPVMIKFALPQRAYKISVNPSSRAYICIEEAKDEMTLLYEITREENHSLAKSRPQSISLREHRQLVTMYVAWSALFVVFTSMALILATGTVIAAPLSLVALYILSGILAYIDSKKNS